MPRKKIAAFKAGRTKAGDAPHRRVGGRSSIFAMTNSVGASFGRPRLKNYLETIKQGKVPSSPIWAAEDYITIRSCVNASILESRGIRP